MVTREIDSSPDLIESDQQWGQPMARLFPEACRAISWKCPDCGDSAGRLVMAVSSVVVHLNDDHDWDRLRIADYVEELIDGNRLTTEASYL